MIQQGRKIKDARREENCWRNVFEEARGGEATDKKLRSSP